MKYIYSLLFSLILLQIASASSLVDVNVIGVGARAMSMGKAYTAAARDTDSIFMNPAGLSSCKDVSFTSMHASLLDEVGYYMLAVSYPSKYANFGLGATCATMKSIPLTRWTTTLGVLRPEVYGNTGYSSTMIVFSGAAKLDEISGNKKLSAISAGASLKYYNQMFSSTSGSMEGSNGSGIDIDLGLDIQPKDWLRFGLVFSNALSQSLGGKFMWQRNGITEDIPASMRLGTAIDLIGETGIKKMGDSKLLFTMDCEKNVSQSGKPLLLRMGTEWCPVKFLALRAGMDQQAIDGGAVESKLSFGVGLQLQGFTFDYAFRRIGDLPDNSTHFISLGFTQG